MPILDLDALLAPISDSAPSGADIAYEPIVDEIKEARRADDDYLSQGDWKTDIKVADWPKAKKLAAEALSTRSKDLQITAWLIEAVTNLHGFAGAAEGFALLDGLLQQFWDTLHPEKDGDDVELRIGRLVWLDNNLPQTLRRIPMTGPVGESKGHGWSRWQESRDVDNLARQNEDLFKQALKEGKIGSELWDAAVSQTPAAFYQQLQIDSTAALDAAKALVKTVDDKFGYDAPSLGQIVEALANVVKLATKLAGDKGVLPAAVSEAPAEETVAEVAEGAAAAPVAAVQNVRAGPPTTREEALRRLHEIAEFYRGAEPHSPVTYLLEKATRWGTMRLDEWIREVVRDDSTRRNLKEMLGYSEE
ncbi:type VI secretion system protein ImpA [Andreprevotia lacus DSM 23236]|jgi:type VI secretion system protein ImpA|uniref:Type VI secretion system protein ImpA n=1 Tax=Andreprevotia lacus DSM 23236 TaxID=1121001 RepID=A0A1W1XFQ8_9NEIS|nr:type VI secretion system protein TssA [Andreprevotia lacus]SMC22825.1 type VI secretion system protein ImpA [Andreprevotia lacus DSM 23236]